MNAVRRIFSGIQPTGVPHLGNYLGALKNWVSLQNEKDQVLFSIVDLHALTMPQDADILRENIKITAASLLSCGLNPQKSIIFQQSKVPEHAELCWILSCLTSTGELQRMHQWKTKKKSQREKSSLGLLSYPVLMASDILLYKSTHVPVGEDQTQHIELARDISRLFNNRFGHIFPGPEAILGKSCRVMNLQEPTKKMSKSEVSNRGRIDLTDTSEMIKRKILKSVTDSISDISYDPETRPGVSNLIDIHSAVSELTTKEIVGKYEDTRIFTKHLKADLAEMLIDELESFRKEFEIIVKEEDYLEKVLEDGNLRAREIATNNLAEIKNKLGLVI
eukprot:gene243-860_t